MKNRSKLIGIVMALVLTFSFASCANETAASVHIKNTFDEEITISISYLGNSDSTTYPSEFGTGVYFDDNTIPANTIKKFDVESGGYRISFFVTSSPNINGTKYAYIQGYGTHTLVIF